MTKDYPMNLKEFIEYCRKSTQRHIRLIGEYADEKKSNLQTKLQWDVFLKRNLRAARDLSVFSDDQISEAIEKINNAEKVYLKEWTMESILKYLLK